MEKIKQIVIKHKRFIKFGFVGFVTVLIDLGIYNAGLYFSLNQYLARFISLIVTITLGFFWHKHWTFRNKSSRTQEQYMKFISVSMIGIGLNLLIMWSLSPLILFIESDKIRANVVAITAIGMVFFFNYFMQKNWTFVNNKN